MKPARPVYLAGGAHTTYRGKLHPEFIWKGHPDFGRRENPTIEDYLRQATHEALAATGVDSVDVERAVVGNFAGECFAKQGHLGSLLAGIETGLRGKPILRVEGACASGGLALVTAAEAVAAGADLVLVAGVEVQTTVSAREGADYLARAGYYAQQRSMDPFTFPCLFARRVRAYKEAYGVSDEVLAHAVVKAHHNAALNPKAHLHAVGAETTLRAATETSDRNAVFLENPRYREHLRTLGCSLVTDGASAVLLASEEGLRRAQTKRDDAVRLLAWSVCVEPLQDTSPDPLRLVAVESAARSAYAASGIRPQDIGIAEVHDCFHIAEVEHMEALGFVPPGAGAAWIASGATAINGPLPVNTGGGLMGFGHPVGATGVKQALEVCRQLRGQCGRYQIPGNPRYGISANMGGDDRTAVVVVYGG